MNRFYFRVIYIASLVLALAALAVWVKSSSSGVWPTVSAAPSGEDQAVSSDSALSRMREL